MLLERTPPDAEPGAAGPSPWERRGRDALAVLPPLVPAVGTVYLAFQAGGFYPEAYALVATVLAVALALRVVTVGRPFAGLSPWSLVSGGAFALLGVWMLLSPSWSHSGARAIAEFDRLLMYLLVFTLCASLAPRLTRLSWALRWTALAIAIVCGAGVLSRLRPDLLSTPPGFAFGRLDYPVTYWNGLGMLGGIGVVLGLHLCASTREPYWARVLAAPLPVLCAVCTYLTLSRGGIAATVVGVVVYVVLGRPRGLPAAVIAAGGATLYAVKRAYDADLLVTDQWHGAAGLAQGRSVFSTLLVAMALALIVRLVLLALDIVTDRALDQVHVPRPARLGIWAGAVVAVVLVLVAAGAPAYAHREVNSFLDASPAPVTSTDVRDRLKDFNNNGRVAHWKIALNAYRTAPLHGSGVGTFENLWAEHRPSPGHVLDAHSLYIETLGEQGIVGAVLLVIALGSMLVGLAWRLRGPDRAAAAAVLAAACAWTVHAGVDWDWELTSVSLWLFGLAGFALARPVVPAVGPAGAVAAAEPAPGRSIRRSPGVGRPAALGAGPSPGLARALRVPVALAILVLALSPFQLYRASTHLRTAETAFRAGNCPATVDAALGSLGAVGALPRPWQLISYCDVRLGQDTLAVQAANAAVRRDPANWQYRYGLALVQGAAGQDPRAAAAEAARLDPLGENPRLAVRRFKAAKGPKAWSRVARRLPLS